MNCTWITAGVIALGTLGMTACTNGSEPSAEPSLVGGMAVCDESTLRTALEDYLASEPDGESMFSLDGFECADGWAVAFPTVGVDSEDEDTAYTYTQVFRAEGQFWIPVDDRTTVCGTIDLDNPASFPSDSQVPESIWKSACNTN